MKHTPERRFLKQQFRVSEPGDAPKITGYAAVFDASSEDLGWFTEQVDPHAFDAVLASGPDVRGLFNHNPDVVLGRSKAGTLQLKVDARGLAYEITPPDTQAARDLMVSMRRGDITQSSFGFIVARDQWTDEPDGTVTRRILEVSELLDVSPVTFPAYPQSAAQVNSLPRSMPAEIRAKLVSRGAPAGCTCECAQCQAGSCGICSNANCNDPECACMQNRTLRRKTHTKMVDGENLTADCFLIVGDTQKTDTWELPWKFSDEEKTKSHLRDALARFDQVEGVSDEEKKKAWDELVKLCKEHGIDVNPDDERAWKSRAEMRLRLALARTETAGRPN
jgi:HK97 family phage prohead protease